MFPPQLPGFPRIISIWGLLELVISFHHVMNYSIGSFVGSNPVLLAAQGMYTKIIQDFHTKTTAVLLT